MSQKRGFTEAELLALPLDSLERAEAEAESLHKEAKVRRYKMS
jgi:hypothetical protein